MCLYDKVHTGVCCLSIYTIVIDTDMTDITF